MFLIRRKICCPLCFPPSASPLPLLLPHPRHPHPEGSLSRWEIPAWAGTGCCCRKRWGCHSSVQPSTDLSSAAAAAALSVAEPSLCTVTSASLEHPAAARHLQPSHECLSFFSSGWLLFSISLLKYCKYNFCCGSLVTAFEEFLSPVLSSGSY